MDMSHEFNPTGEGPKNNKLATLPEQQVAPADSLDTRLKGLFTDRPEALKHAENTLLASKDRFTDEWWHQLYNLCDNFHLNEEYYQLSGTVINTLSSFPKDAKLPYNFSHWANRSLKDSKLKKRILNTLDDPAIPSSLRSQIPAQLAQDPEIQSLDVILKGYRLFGEPVGQEMRKNIIPLFMAGLAVQDVFDTNKDVLVKLCAATTTYKEDKKTDVRTASKSSSIVSRVSRYLSPSTFLKSPERKRQEAERRVVAIRDLVRELYPVHEKYYNTKEEFSRNIHDRLLNLTEEEINTMSNFNDYEQEITQQNYNYEVSRDASSLPIDTVERYLSNIRQLKTIKNFGRLTRYIFGRGIIAPYTVLGRAVSVWGLPKEIPITSIFHHLSGLDHSGNLDDRIVDEFLLGINKDIFSNDKIKPIARRNLRIVMAFPIAQQTPTLNIGPLSNLRDFDTFLENNHMTLEMSLAFPEHAPALMQDKMKETKIFVWKHGEGMLKDASDLKFLNRLVGEFGQKADPLIRGYQECLEAGVVTTEEKELVLEFAKQFRVVAPATLAGYKEAKQGGFEKGYIAQLKALAEKMTGSGTITEEERNRPYYKDLLKHVYSNNSGQWSSFESNDSCADRSSDLADFKINPRYEIDLLSQSEIRIKAGETQDHSVQDEVQRPIVEIAKRLDALGHDKEKIQLMLKEDIDKTLKEISEKGGLQGIDLASLTSTEEKMFLILTDSIYGIGSIDPKRVKDLVTTYEFATFEDISDYMAGTRDRVSRANNQDYALLCEVGAFYSDRIKEVNRRLVEEAYKNPQIEALMPEYFRKLSQESSTSQKQDKINRLQINRLSTSESFVKQLTLVLEKRRGRKYEPEEVKEIIRRYEGVTGGLQEKASSSQNPQTRAFYGQLRSQRERSFEALRVIRGEKVDPQKVHLGEINLQQVLETETGIKEGKYDEEQFASYTAQRFIDIFEDEKIKIEGELAKFESITGKQREVLYGYISKSKESANARMVGGVCVAGDNPSKNKNQNMWDMPNYLQLVFQEPDTLQCQGLVLLHHFTQDEKRVLAASLNPSSTYLYSVDETALFNGIMGTLEQFAKDNNIDLITFSQNKTIRTNRTGGQFEKTMDTKITSVDKKFKFDSSQTFSYSPKYQLQDMDVAWERT